MKKVLFTSVFALALVGCVTASEVSTLVPQSINSVDSSSKLSQAVSVESLSAEASGAYKNQVSDEALASALKEALSQNGMLATEGAAYTVIPNVVDLKQPAIGIDMKVTATVNYIVKDESGKIVMDKTIYVYCIDFYVYWLFECGAFEQRR